MERDTALKILSEHKAELRRKHGVGSIAIFGSTARNEARPNSDVDILVEFERPIGFFELAEVRFYLEGALGQQVDLATSGSLRPPVRERVYEDVVYAS
jgi:predicted nucleotidyltransferase